MGPRKKPHPERFACYEVKGERFHAQIDDVFQYNWWEVFCFPYILCSRLWECCIALCAGTNQCMIYWMVIQWIVCKITRFTTPDPIIFPYYFYMFCQVILLTLGFAWLWNLFGKSVLIPYLKAYYDAFVLVNAKKETMQRQAEGEEGSTPTRLKFRRYCFKKGEIFDVPPEEAFSDNGTWCSPNFMLYTLAIVIDVVIYEFLL